MKKIGPIRRAVASVRNSYCERPPRDLDWSNWWTDNSGRNLYLHVQHKTDDTVHRVSCRLTDKPRLNMIDGKLFWLIDR